MDDTQQTQQPVQDVTSNMSDVAGMTPPPAPVMPDPVQAAAPADVPAAPVADAPKAAGDDDYSYAEDVLNEILDSLDRIEAKLEAMEKKMG